MSRTYPLQRLLQPTLEATPINCTMSMQLTRDGRHARMGAIASHRPDRVSPLQEINGGEDRVALAFVDLDAHAPNSFSLIS